MGRRVLRFDGPLARGLWIALRAMSFIMPPAAGLAASGGSPSRNDTVRNEEGDLSTQSIMGAVCIYPLRWQGWLRFPVFTT